MAKDKVEVAQQPSEAVAQVEVNSEPSDFFDDQLVEGIDPNPRIRQPYIVPRNKSQNPCWIIPKDCARDCGWINYKNENWIQHEFGDSVKPVLYMFEPRVIVLHATPTFGINKKSGDFIGVTNWDEYVHDPEENELQRKLLVLLLDENNMPLHQKPLQYSATGNAGVSFVKALIGGKDKVKNTQHMGFYRELEEAIAVRYENAGKEFPMYRTTFESKERVEEPWHNVSVFCPKFMPEKRGDATDVSKQSVCCITADWVHPTPETAHQFWAKDLKPVVANLMAENKDWGKRFLQPATPVTIQPWDGTEVINNF